jgi:tripartite-type tricarboxylate transporter receptor subunit TctC
MLRRTFLASSAAALASGASAAEAEWPSRPIRLLVGFAPGGTADILARKLQTPLGARLGKPVVIENRPGASGMTAATEVARAGADGTTFALVVSTHASLPATNRKLPYDTERDFTPVVLVGNIPLVLMVNPKSPFRTLADLVAAAKQRPGSLNYAIPGVGLSHHFAGELLKQRAGIDIVPVSYRGTAPALNDVIAGQVDMTFGTLPAVMGAIGGDLVRPLAITAPKRAEALPAVPTVAESGYDDFDVSEWFGVVAPAATPASVIARLNAEVNAVLGEPELRDWMAANSVARAGKAPGDFQAFVSSEIAKLSQIAQKAGISVD